MRTTNETRKPRVEPATTGVVADGNAVTNNNTTVRPSGEVNLPADNTAVIGAPGSSGHSTGPSPLVDVQIPGALKVNQPLSAYGLDRLSPDARSAIHTSDTLDVAVLNANAQGRELLGPIKDGKDAFIHTTLMTFGDTLSMVLGTKAKVSAITEALKAGKPQAEAEAAGATAEKAAIAAIQPLIDATKAISPIIVPRHLNRLPENNGEYGQRVLYIPQGEENATDLKNVLKDLAARGCMLDKNKVHTALEYPGGLPKSLAEGESVQNGVTHGGRISLSKYNGEIMWYDKPADYGRSTSTAPTDKYWDYLTVFDPATIEWGAPTKPKNDTFKGWAENADIWAALDILTVEFANAHPNPAYRSYKRNPVEIMSANDLPPFAASILTAANGTLGAESKAALEKLHHFAEYCEEGKTNNKNIGLNTPLNQRSVREGRITAEAFANYEKMVAVFQSADGWDKNPSKGWAKLKEAGFVNDMQLSKLESTGYIHQALVIMPETLRPWTYYEPKGVETDKTKDGFGLFAKPATLAQLAGNFIGGNIPHAKLTEAFADDVAGVLKKSADDPAKQILLGLLQQMGLVQDPRNLDQLAGGAAALPKVIAAGFQGLFMHGMKETFFEKLRVNEMGPEDQKKIGDLFERFSDVVFDPKLALDNDARIKAIMAIDAEFREIRVTLDGNEVRPIQFYSPVQGVEGPRGGPFMPEAVGHHHLAIGVKSGYQKAP